MNSIERKVFNGLIGASWLRMQIEVETGKSNSL